MSAARRGAVAATVVLLGLLALLLSPATGRAVTERLVSAPAAGTPAASSSSSSRCTPTLLNPCSTPSLGPTPSPTETETTTTQVSTLTYAVLPGDTGAIPPTATPKPPPTPAPSPAAVTDTGASALGTDTTATSSELTQASTVINPQPGGEASSVLPLTVLAFLIVAGGGAIFLITRLR